jgi:hydroxypyruvate isomerase
LKRSACLELLFRDEPDFVRRIARARAAGFDAIEFWRWSDKDIGAIAAETRRLGIGVAGFLAEPKVSLIDSGSLAGFLDGLDRSVKVAQLLGAPYLYTQSGLPVAGMGPEAMFSSICAGLARAAERLRGSGVTLLLEPVSDSPGTYLSDNALGFDIVARVDRAEVRLLYDFYHANVLGQDWRAALPRIHLAGHIHLADHPGRGAPGTGHLPIAAFLEALAAAGYKGMIGYEHR